MKRWCLPLLWLTACQPALNHQPKAVRMNGSPLFPGGRSARPLPEGVVVYRSGAPEATLSGPSLLRAGKAGYNIHCTACHGLDGAGGVAGLRGFRGIPSLLDPHARARSAAAVEKIILRGEGRMAAMGNRLPPADAHAIAAYLAVLQWSQRVAVSELPPAERARVEAGP